MIKFIAGLAMRIWLWLASSFRRAPKPLQTVYLEELPGRLDANSVYVLGEGPYKWFVALLCPCGCGAKLQMSLLPDAIPKWQVITHADKSISLHPSIWRKLGCRSHFFLRRGCIEWCHPR